MRRSIAVSLLALLLLVLVGCRIESTGGTDDLPGSEWVLTSLSGKAPVEGTQITIVFSDIAVAGYAGCNHYGADYTLSGERIGFRRVESTLQLCEEPPGVNEQETEFLTALQFISRNELAGDRLMLSNEGDIRLEFGRRSPGYGDPSALVGTSWLLLTVDGVPPIEGSAISLEFGEDGQLSGSAGCRGYEGRYEADEGRLALTFLSMTGEACDGPLEFLRQESDFTTQLEQAETIRLDEDSLELETVRGEVLRFAPLEP